MVFHEVDSITSVISGHNVIIYFVEGKNLTDCNDIRLRMILETLMEMLQKKNDEMLVVKVLHSSIQFKQFIELYKPEVTGLVTLFVVNNKGIPIMCEQVAEEDSIPSVIDSLSTICKLNPISRTEINKIKQLGTKATVFRSNAGKTQTNSSSEVVSRLNLVDAQHEASQDQSVQDLGLPVECLSLEESSESAANPLSDVDNKNADIKQPDSTNLQIRLPDGSKFVHKFERNSMLQEVWVFISVKCNIKNFNMKTYDRADYFSEDEYRMTLSDLGLCPNGVVIVVDKQTVLYNNNGPFSIITYGIRQIMSKSTSFFFYIQGVVRMFWNSIFYNNDRPRPNDSGHRQIRSDEGSSSNSSSVRERRQKKTSSRQFGNIHTLRRNEDSDDENNRYNGNSTQQK